MGANRRAIPAEDREKIVRLYKLGVSVDAIKARLGCDRSAIARIVRESGEQPRKASERF